MTDPLTAYRPVVEPRDRTAESLLALRRYWGLSQQGLGDLLHVNKGHICRLESGEKAPSHFLLQALALLAKVEVSAFRAGLDLADVAPPPVARPRDENGVSSGDQQHTYEDLLSLVKAYLVAFGPFPLSDDVLVVDVTGRTHYLMRPEDMETWAAHEGKGSTAILITAKS